MEVEAKHWIVMAEDGSFARVPRQDLQAQLGDEVSFSNPRSLRQWTWISVGAGVVAALLGFLFLVWPSTVERAEMHVYVDMNPSVELGLDDQYRVITIRALNSSAKPLVDNLDWRGRKAESVVADLLLSVKKEGRMLGKDNVILSSGTEAHSSEALLKNIQRKIERDPRLESESLAVYTLSLPSDLVKQAQDNNISPGKYAVWLLASHVGEPVAFEKVSEFSISELMEHEEIPLLIENPPPAEEWTRWLNDENNQQETETIKEQNSRSDGQHEEPPQFEDSSSSEKQIEEEKERDGSRSEDEEDHPVKIEAGQTEGDEESEEIKKKTDE